MRSLRGGAFDTYFENQATCQFQSGDTPVSRRHNVGFRCAIGVADLAPEITDELMGSEALSDDSDDAQAIDESADCSVEHEEVTA
jgi:iron(II)-dependent oxidoreductase